eukprot:CAMPEP_0179141242 /NCGR_PEP_ID=MMETSP0796-20121207/67717_1 /TAXON_ID=73915 /ORGANISM="Pyrodinium bahamense, Strain pbaha01" /LENGTH=127 /DNA_ID=CAMNT_0020840923 /DNA_START=82 /DNA_END=462 /DNA_ORIENTATION=-
MIQKAWAGLQCLALAESWKGELTSEGARHVCQGTDAGSAKGNSVPSQAGVNLEYAQVRALADNSHAASNHDLAHATSSHDLTIWRVHCAGDQSRTEEYAHRSQLCGEDVDAETTCSNSKGPTPRCPR